MKIVEEDLSFDKLLAVAQQHDTSDVLKKFEKLMPTQLIKKPSTPPVCQTCDIKSKIKKVDLPTTLDELEVFLYDIKDEEDLEIVINQFKKCYQEYLDKLKKYDEVTKEGLKQLFSSEEFKSYKQHIDFANDYKALVVGLKPDAKSREIISLCNLFETPNNQSDWNTCMNDMRIEDKINKIKSMNLNLSQTDEDILNSAEIYIGFKKTIERFKNSKKYKKVAKYQTFLNNRIIEFKNLEKEFKKDELKLKKKADDLGSNIITNIIPRKAE